MRTREDADTFNGFPSSGLATAVPNLFFSRLMPQIETPEELAVSVYFFFAQGLKRGWPRFLTLRQLAADVALLHSLARLCGRHDQEALERGLKLAVARGTIVRASVNASGRQEELYAVNTPANRRALEALAERGIVLEEPLPPLAAVPPPNIFVLYEQNVGSITPLIAEHLQEAEERYPADWIREAFREAVSLNKRSWRYIEGILRRWQREGPDYEELGRDTKAEWLARRYASGKRRRSGPRLRA